VTYSYHIEFEAQGAGETYFPPPYPTYNDYYVHPTLTAKMQDGKIHKQQKSRLMKENANHARTFIKMTANVLKPIIDAVPTEKRKRKLGTYREESTRKIGNTTVHVSAHFIPTKGKSKIPNYHVKSRSYYKNRKAGAMRIPSRLSKF
jgi:hypothetical protein